MKIIKPVVAVDLDDTLYDFVGRLLKLYNYRYNDNVHIEDITDWDIQSFLKPECKNIFVEFATESFFESITISPVITALLETLNELSKLYFVTSANAESLVYRHRLLENNLGFYKEAQIVKLSDKTLFNCSYILGDNPQNIVTHKCFGMLVRKPWNTAVSKQSKTTEEWLSFLIAKLMKERETIIAGSN